MWYINFSCATKACLQKINYRIRQQGLPEFICSILTSGQILLFRQENSFIFMRMALYRGFSFLVTGRHVVRPPLTRNASECFIEHSTHETLFKRAVPVRAYDGDIYGYNSESDCTIDREHTRRFHTLAYISNTSSQFKVIDTCVN